MRIENKVALITGGASGIGKAIAELFAREGAKVMIADINEKLGVETVGAITKKQGEAKFVKGDVTSFTDAKRMVSETVEAFGCFDILINNAGIHRHGTVEETNEETWDLVLDVCLKSVYIVSKAAIPVMKKRGGAIINTASYCSIAGVSGMAAYSAAKGGVYTLTMSMALELAPFGMRVNCVCPGGVLTPLFDEILKRGGGKEKMDAMFPLGRLQRPEDIAPAYLYLASEESGQVTGTYIIVDGGMSAR